ncbi:MAG: tRNA (N6-isopentenyl adenosine(37)-C2)-methylthiotransferase MiaB [Candidatus Eisenbacteria bacterium]|nr:tRNA (N6-isopentenyl adenosine(37)-C2)-methylthiotransferase MiaB [Candidatus Latescibacterota bacterium]MBD3303417.1 tRNA (N6-isopentenyl adenosine(37)-C2)-methylthiotransferase MiaB [Candidatus Eisenbacteria bacterium]
MSRPPRPRIYLETYGCQMNEADTGMMAGLLASSGWERIDRPELADVILLNTCAVRERAEERVAGRVRHLARLKRYRPDLRIGLAGCMAQHLGRDLLARLPELDLLAGPDSYRRLADLLGRSDEGPLVDLALDKKERYEDLSPSPEAGLHAWVPIMRGCDRFCTFCVVPHVRGREKSLPAERIVGSVRDLVASGTVAVTLLGQTVNSYRDGAVDFAGLLERIARIPGLLRIRFTSPHPADFTRSFFAVMAEHRNLCKQIHLPVQSGSTRILEAMKRGHTREEFLALVGEIRTVLPDVSLTTDLIVGFPSETIEDYESTLSLLEEVRFDGAFMFRYSPRPGTYAVRKQPDDVPDEEKARRLHGLIELQERISAERYARWVGREVEVLVEGPSRRDRSCARGRSDDNKTVILPAEGARPGEIATVRIARATAHTLIAAGVPGPETDDEESGLTLLAD